MGCGNVRAARAVQQEPIGLVPRPQIAWDQENHSFEERTSRIDSRNAKAEEGSGLTTEKPMLDLSSSTNSEDMCHESLPALSASRCSRSSRALRRAKSARWIAVDAQHLALEINERAKDTGLRRAVTDNAIAEMHGVQGHFKHQSSNLGKGERNAANPTSTCPFLGTPFSFKMRGLKPASYSLLKQSSGRLGVYCNRRQFHMPKPSVITGEID
eukprot:s1624_g7.t1